MKFIGITGGVGAGKSEILGYLKMRPGTKVMLADEIAHDLMEPGTSCYEKIKKQFAGEDIFLPDGRFDRGKMAEVIFSEEEKRKQMNAIVHPAVKEFVIETANAERKKGTLQFLFLEAALLIEEHYDEICDELWYIYTREDIRKQRLMASRGYSEEKVYQIFDSQLSEETYRRYCKCVLDNNGTVEKTYSQLEQALKNIESE
ncbi:MAG: dephospho-CoA kinase [Clostridiales bacterium]|nr:dephospho-CoA kinase [Clostridiales bacterium]